MQLNRSGQSADYDTPEHDGLIDRANHCGSEAIEIARQFVRPLFFASANVAGWAE